MVTFGSLMKLTSIQGRWRLDEFLQSCFHRMYYLTIKKTKVYYSITRTDYISIASTPGEVGGRKDP